MFFAHQWRECMAYATTDDLMSGEWSDTKVIMLPTTTSNTNHMAVCDFNGKSYFIYHNGSLPKGNGYRRSACVCKLNFNEDGTGYYMAHHDSEKETLEEKVMIQHYKML